MSEEIKKDLKLASEICSDRENKKCLDVAFFMALNFQKKAKVIRISTEGKSIIGYISHIKHEESISESGVHWAIMLHDNVFDNLHPEGELLCDWIKNFSYPGFQGLEKFFEENDIEVMEINSFLETLCETVNILKK